MHSFFSMLRKYTPHLVAFSLISVLLIGIIALTNRQTLAQFVAANTPTNHTTPPDDPTIIPLTTPTVNYTPSPLITPTINLTSMNHIAGGFSIQTNTTVANAAAEGVNATLVYGYVPKGDDPLSLTLKAHNMKIIDEMPWEYLYYFECQTHNTCSVSFPELTSTQALYTDIANHLQQERDNSMIVGYWVLDDWNYGNGTARDILVHINGLIHQYTPGKPSICGFPGGLAPLPTTDSGWNDAQADNFSPQGCDMVGLYIYGDGDLTGTYDWTMSHTLPAVFASLKQRGWDRTKEPLVGIPQAFGGPDQSGTQWPIPTANSIETQTKTYCQQGAVAVIFYEWDTNEQTPMTNPQIAQGVKKGITDCESIWGS